MPSPDALDRGAARERRDARQEIELHPIPAPKGGPYPTTEQLLSRAYHEMQRLMAEREPLIEAFTEIVAWHRVVCGCTGEACGYGERLAHLRAALGGSDRD